MPGLPGCADPLPLVRATGEWRPRRQRRAAHGPTVQLMAPRARSIPEQHRQSRPRATAARSRAWRATVQAPTGDAVVIRVARTAPAPHRVHRGGRASAKRAARPTRWSRQHRVGPDASQARRAIRRVVHATPRPAPHPHVRVASAVRASSKASRKIRHRQRDRSRRRMPIGRLLAGSSTSHSKAAPVASASDCASPSSDGYAGVAQAKHLAPQIAPCAGVVLVGPKQSRQPRACAGAIEDQDREQCERLARADVNNPLVDHQLRRTEQTQLNAPCVRRVCTSGSRRGRPLHREIIRRRLLQDRSDGLQLAAAARPGRRQALAVIGCEDDPYSGAASPSASIRIKRSRPCIAAAFLRARRAARPARV